MRAYKSSRDILKAHEINNSWEMDGDARGHGINQQTSVFQT